MIFIFYYINNNLNNSYIIVLITRRNEPYEHRIKIEQQRILTKSITQKNHRRATTKSRHKITFKFLPTKKYHKLPRKTIYNKANKYLQLYFSSIRKPTNQKHITSFFIHKVKWKKLSMIFIFCYIYNNLNNFYIIVSHHEAERIVNVTSGLSSSTIKVENTCTSSIVITTAAHQLDHITK